MFGEPGFVGGQRAPRQCHELHEPLTRVSSSPKQVSAPGWQVRSLPSDRARALLRSPETGPTAGLTPEGVNPIASKEASGRFCQNPAEESEKADLVACEKRAQNRGELLLFIILQIIARLRK